MFRLPERCQVVDVGAHPGCACGVVGDNEGMSDYNVMVTGKFRKCLERQVTEGLLIDKCEKSGGKLLNSKNEYFTPKNVQTIFKQW